MIDRAGGDGDEDVLMLGTMTEMIERCKMVKKCMARWRRRATRKYLTKLHNWPKQIIAGTLFIVFFWGIICWRQCARQP